MFSIVNVELLISHHLPEFAIGVLEAVCLHAKAAGCDAVKGVGD